MAPADMAISGTGSLFIDYETDAGSCKGHRRERPNCWTNKEKYKYKIHKLEVIQKRLIIQIWNKHKAKFIKQESG